MDSQRPNDVSPEAMQARIQQARREAENLKDRIKRKKDELADTTRKSFIYYVNWPSFPVIMVINQILHLLLTLASCCFQFAPSRSNHTSQSPETS